MSDHAHVDLSSLQAWNDSSLHRHQDRIGVKGVNAYARDTKISDVCGGGGMEMRKDRNCV